MNKKHKAIPFLTAAGFLLLASIVIFTVGNHFNQSVTPQELVAVPVGARLEKVEKDKNSKIETTTIVFSGLEHTLSVIYEAYKNQLIDSGWNITSENITDKMIDLSASKDVGLVNIRIAESGQDIYVYVVFRAS